MDEKKNKDLEDKRKQIIPKNLLLLPPDAPERDFLEDLAQKIPDLELPLEQKNSEKPSKDKDQPD